MNAEAAEARVPWHTHGLNTLWLHRLANWGTRHLPRVVCHAIAHVTAEGFLLATRRERAAVEKNLARVLGPKTPRRELRRMSRRLYHNYAVCFVDFLRSPSFRTLEDGRLRYVPEHKEWFNEALAKGNGVLLISGHLGNWEVGASLFTLQGYELTVVTAEEDAAGVNDFIRSLRVGGRAEVIVLGSHTTAVLDIVRALRRNRIVALLVDRAYGPQSSLVPFLHGQARFPTGIYRLAKKTGAPVIPAFIVGLPGRRYTTICTPPLALPDSGDAERDAAEFARRIAACFEPIYREHPDQLFNFFPMWEEDQAATT